MYNNSPSMGTFDSIGMGTTYPIRNGCVKDR